MDRTPTEITELVAQLERDLDELKSAQVFGGDALFVNEYSEKLSNDASATYTLTLTPDSELGCLPSKLYLKWTNPNIQGQSSANYVVDQVYRDDGVFEWRIVGGHVNNFDTALVLQWIGSGTVSLTREA